jgi:plastocyanin
MNRSQRRPIGPLSLLVIGTALAVAADAATGQDGAATRRFELVISERELAGEPRTIRVGQGDVVELTWISDEAGELHLHGYDIAFEVAPAGPTVITFEAHATGRYPVTSHGFGDETGHRHATLLYIEVHPD